MPAKVLSKLAQQIMMRHDLGIRIPNIFEFGKHLVRTFEFLEMNNLVVELNIISLPKRNKNERKQESVQHQVKRGMDYVTVSL